MDRCNFDFALVDGAVDGFQQFLRVGERGNFADDEVASLDVDARAERDFAVAVLVFGGVHDAALEKVGEELERFIAQNGNLGVEQFVEVVRHDVGARSRSETRRAHEQERRNFDGKADRLFVAGVVGIDEFGDVVVEQHVAPELGEPRFNVTGRRGAVAGDDAAEVSLFLDEEFLVRKIDERIADGGVAVGMELHGSADDVCDFVEGAVVDAVHFPENTSLHGLESVVDVRNCTVLDDV